MPRFSLPQVLLAVCLVLSLTACGKKHTSASAPRAMPSPAVAGATQMGLASWYGEPYHGRRAANGEVYDMNKLTAAHRTLPFDTLVKVLNLENSREVQVRINDRGPFVEGRIIDLSRAAAQRIAMIGPGVAQVRIEVLGARRGADAAERKPASPPAETSEVAPSPEPPATFPDERDNAINETGYAVQIGAFRDSKAAEKLRRRMAARFGGAYIENVRSDEGVLYRVRVGPKSTRAEAEQLAAILEREDIRPLLVQVAPPAHN